MGKIFDLDSPIMRALTKMADVMWLNVLTLIFAVPLIVEQFFMLGPILMGEQEFAVNYVLYAWLFGIIASIPLGPALCAMHFVLLKIVRDEESYVTKAFFKALKENFKQGAILMVIVFAAGGILLMDYLLMKNVGTVYKYILFAVALMLYLASLYVFPLQAKFINKIPSTIKNSFLMAILALPKTIAMAICTLLPFVLYYLFDYKIVPILFLFGFAGPGYLCAALYSETFKKFEPKEEAVSEEEELDNAIRKIDEEEDQ